MVDSDLYLVGLEVDTGELVAEVMPCLLCKRVIINAGVSRVILPEQPKGFKYIDVDDWTLEERIALREDTPK